MEKEIEKKAWSRPELNVLLRTKPEEAVLQGCKGIPAQGPGYGQGIWCDHKNKGICYEIASS